MVAERKTRAEVDAFYLPRIAAARAEAEERRDEAWLDVPFPVCGIPLRPLTLRDYLALTAAGNAHVAAVTPPEEPVAELRFWTNHNFALIWLLSPDYRPVPAARDAFMAANVGRLPFGDLLAGIADYLRVVFADRPRVVRREQSDVVPVSVSASFAAFWIHDFATTYGWSADQTLAMPLSRIFQLRQLLRHDATVAAGKRPMPAADEADQLAAAAFSEIAALGDTA